MAWRCADEPHRAVLVVDHVADAAATSDLVLSLLHVAAVVPVRGQVAAEPVLTVVAGSTRGSVRKVSRQRRVFGRAWRHTSSQPAAAALVPNRTSHWPAGGGAGTRSPRRGLTRGPRLARSHPR